MSIFDKIFGKKKTIDTIIPTSKQSIDNMTVNNFVTTPSKKIPITFVSAVRCEVNAIVADELKRHFIAFDVETTGLSPDVDRIVEIGAVEFVNGVEVRRFTTLVNAGVSISSSATSVNHITNEMLQRAPSENNVYPYLVEFLGDAIRGKVYMCAHNASFDFCFLERTFRRLGISGEIHYVDTLSLCRNNIKGLENYRQGTLEKYFGLVNEKSHRAVSDAENCGKILLKTIECGESNYAAEKERIGRNRPSDDELEVCAVIQKILLDAGLDLDILRFKKSSSTIDGACLYNFVSFKFSKKGRYIILPERIATESGFITESCINSEGGAENKRVFFASPMELLRFSSYFVDKYKHTYRSAREYLDKNRRFSAEVQIYMSEWYKIEYDELCCLLRQIREKDYSDIEIPKFEEEILRSDVTINPLNNRVPLNKIRNYFDLDKGFDEGYRYWVDGEKLRKEGKYNDAIQLFDHARYHGYFAPALYESYAITFHKLKDYENEIDILDEGIERFKSAKWNASKFITRRDTAIKALLKMIEVEKVSREKSEAKKKKNEDRENNLKEKKNQPIGKAIIQLDDEGNVIAEYQTVTEAASTVGISTKSIRDAAKGIQKHAAGFCWKYKEDNG